MIDKWRSLSANERFWLLYFLLSVLVSFAFGYLFFRYSVMDLCKSPIEPIMQHDIYK